MVMKALRDGASGGILKFVLFGILALAAGGLVFTDVGGFFRGGGGTDVAKVAGQPISLQSFDRIAQRTLAPLQITPQKAHQLGYLREILNSELRRRILVTDAQEQGIMIGKDQVIDEIQNIIAPAIQNGLSPQGALETLLRNQGMSEGELMASLSSERAFSLFSNALQAGTLYAPKALQNATYVFENETRDLRYITFLNKDFENINKATDEQLAALYDATKESYASPERRTLQILRLKTSALKDTLEISEEDLTAAYEDNIEDFITPANRTITQAITNSEEEAKVLYESAQKGKSFKATANDAGADYIPSRIFNEGNILDEIKTIVFDAEATGTLEPIETPLGWAVINLEKIEDTKTTTFEEAKKELRADLIEDRLVDELYAIVDEIDEAFASGTSLEEAAKTFGLTVQTISDLNAYGQDGKDKTPLNDALGANAPEAIQTAFKLDSGETSSMFELNSGDFAAIHALSITPKSYKPFEDVKTAIQTRWNNDQKNLGNKAHVSDLQKSADGKTLAALAKTEKQSVKTAKAITRASTPKAPLNGRALSSAFNAPQGEVFVIDIDGGFALAEISNSKLPTATPKEDKLKEIKNKTLENFQNEVFVGYVNKRSKKHRAKINDALLDRAYSQSTEGYR